MQLILIAILTNIYYTIQYNSEYRATYTFHGKTATRLAAISQKGVTSPHGGELSVTTIFVFHFFHHYFFRMLILHFFVGGSQCYYLVYIFEFCGDRYCFVCDKINYLLINICLLLTNIYLLGITINS